MRKFWGALILLTLTPVLLAAPSALAFNTRITVYASVAETRVIYIDQSGNIIKVAGNTTKNIAPTVLDQNNHEIPMTDAINQQYERFLKSHDWHLQASKIYDVNLIAVNTAPNTETIKVGLSSPSKLSLSL